MTYACHESTTGNRWTSTLLKGCPERTTVLFPRAERRTRGRDLWMDREMRATFGDPVATDSLGIFSIYVDRDKDYETTNSSLHKRR